MNQLIGAAAAALALCLYCLSRSFFKVEQGHLAVTTTFGRLNRKLLQPGLHSKLPWDQVHEFSVMEKVVELGGEDGAFPLMTEDGTLLKLEAKARLKLSPEKFYSFVFELRRPMEHVRELFRCLLRNEIANVTSSDEGAYSNIRKNMTTLNRDIQRACDSGVQGHYGIELRSLDIADVLPPHELARALNAIEKTRADVSGLYMRALADSEQRIEGAKQGVKIALLRAQGAAREIEVVADALSDLDRAGTLEEYVEHRRVEVFSDAKLNMIRRQS